MHFKCSLLVFLAILSRYWSLGEARAVGAIRSDVIVTKFGPEVDETLENQENSEGDEAKPGWMRRQLVRFGNLASRVSSKLGGGAAKVTGFVEKLCKMLKTIIPIMAAVCNVGQFQFCSSVDAPGQLSEALSQGNPLNLNVPDK